MTVLPIGGVHVTDQMHTMQERVFKSGPSRRRYSEAFKRELVERSLQPGASVSALALEQGMNANVLFSWRRLHLRSLQAAAPEPEAPVLLPVTVEEPAPPVTGSVSRPAATAVRVPAGVIEIDLGRARIRLRGSVDETSVRCVLQTLAGLA